MRRRLHAVWLIPALLATRPAAAQNDVASVFVDVRQGTDLSVTTAPELDFVIVELLGRLWQLPVTGGAATPLTPSDETARHPRVSRDGQQVVYQKLSTTGWDIWLLEIPSGRARAITDSPGNEREPAFAGAGEGIIFAADRSGSYDLWSVADAGGAWEPVSTESGDAGFPDVADNGAIAYIVTEGDTHRLRVRANALTSTLYETRGVLGPPTWRPGGGVIVFAEGAGNARTRLRMALLAPELLIRDLSNGEDLFTSRLGWLDATRFVYAADGQVWERRLAGRNRRPVHLFATAQLPAPARPARPLAAEPPPATTSRAATDAAQLSVVAATGDLWLLRDGTPTQLTDTAGWDEEPLLDPAGNFVIFARSRAGERRLWRLGLGSESPPEPLTPRGQRAFAATLDTTGTRLAWLSGPAAFSISSPAWVNTLYLQDGTRQRGDARIVRALAAPRWLEDNRTAVLSIASLSAAGTPETIAFDAGLRPVEAFAPAAQPPTAAPAAATAAVQPGVVLLNAVPRGAVSAPTAAAAPDRYVIQAGRLFDGIGTEYRRHVDIHVEAGRITQVVARGRLPLPPEVIDATELTVLPGLIDAHTHDLSLLGELAGRAWLAFGVTTVRVVEPLGPGQLALAAAWNAGTLPGPRLLRDGPERTAAPERAPRQLPPLLDDPFVVPPGERPRIELSRTLLPPLRATPGAILARRYSPAQRHYQDVFALQAAADTAEITSLATFTPGATRQLITAYPALRRVFESLFRASDRAAWLTVQPVLDGLEARQQALTRFARAGAQLVIGTEAPHTPPGLGEHIELALLADAGIPNDQVLRSATSTAALALGLEQEIGTVEPGRRADLLIVAGDPLRNIAAALAITAVVRDGRWIERAALLEHSAPDDE